MDETIATVDNPASTPKPPAAFDSVWIPRILIYLVLAVAGAYAWRAGVDFRHWMWDTTVHLRAASAWNLDAGIDRDYDLARTSAVEGPFNQYEKMQAQQPRDVKWLDDPPLRLWIFSQWGKWSMEHFPRANQWRDNHSYALAGPLMQFNLFMEAIGLVSAFLLVRFWAIRGRSSQPKTDSLRYFYRGCIPAIVAVLLLWFNPAIVLSAYGWPAWEMWLIPMFLLAALLASLDWWFTAGVIIGIGAMLNAQMALAIPLLLVWCIIRNGWPAWRLPVTPSILFVVLLVHADLWFASEKFWWISSPNFGIAGVIFLGEMVIAISVPLLWSLIRRPLHPLRYASGLVVAIALIASPWLLSYIPADKLASARAVQTTFGEAWKVPVGAFKIARTVDVPAVFWLCCVLAAAVGLPWVAWLTLEKPAEQDAQPVPVWRKILSLPWAWQVIAAVGVIALIFWPWLLKRNHSQWLEGVSATAAMILAVQLIRPRGISVLAAAAFGTAMLLCMSLFHGSSAWYDCGFHFGTIHWPHMFQNSVDRLGPDNLPAVLYRDFNWPAHDLAVVAFTIPQNFIWRYPEAAFDVSIGGFLQTLFAATLVLCCLGAGMHARRRSPRVLIALSAVWLMFFCFPPQISERYLLFAAGISCICAGASAGMTLLGVFLSLVSFVMMFNTLLAGAAGSNRQHFGKELARQFPQWFDSNSGEKLLSIINVTHPDLGYAVILCTLIFLYFSIAPARRNAECKMQNEDGS